MDRAIAEEQVMDEMNAERHEAAFDKAQRAKMKGETECPFCAMWGQHIKPGTEHRYSHKPSKPDTTHYISDGMNEHDQLREVAVQLNQLEKDYEDLLKAIESAGFMVQRGDYILTDGTHSSVALAPVHTERLIKMALRAYQRDKVVVDAPGV